MVMSKKKKEKDLENITVETTAESAADKTEKKPGFFKKAWRIIRMIFMAIFGKARWFLICIFVSIAVPTIIFTLFDKTAVKEEQVNGTYMFLKSDYSINYVYEACVNDDGKAAIMFDSAGHIVTGKMNIATGESVFAMAPGFTDGKINYTPYGFCVDDDYNLYGLCTVYDQKNQSLATEEYILKFGKNFDNPEIICTLDYDETKLVRGSTANRLNYYNGSKGNCSVVII